ncbi:NAD(P)-dependent oxidoreductase [Acidisphaera sp. L21]|uniref:NAD(P)-dependent oxidoreductase n=1 Tax=Acidisphaera sp. L21 TaxID=1641851 RepID=UPI00131A90D3|nr:NAD(P)-dependent oxidoreductase [Acidisphaera sp. L21]
MSIGFIGLGVMGEPMCRNLATKQAEPVFAFDQSSAPLQRLAAHGVTAAESLAALAAACDVIFMALPSGKHVQAVCADLLAHARAGQTLVDLGTSPVALSRELAVAFAAKGVAYADSPIARTRQAAEAGTLSIMVGADPALFEAIRPLLACMASDITHCGAVGSGQIAKIMNNMVLIQTVIALSEAVAVAERAGMDGRVLLETLSKGSADSFALRNHGLKAIIPGAFPERAFSTDYARKDLLYALELARDAGLTLRGAELADGLLQEAIGAGYGAQYWPVVSKVIAKGQS